MTRLEDLRRQYASLQSDFRAEIKVDGEPFHPNLFMELAEDGIRFWSEDGEAITVPDEALKPIKQRLTWLLGTA